MTNDFCKISDMTQLNHSNEEKSITDNGEVLSMFVCILYFRIF